MPEYLDCEVWQMETQPQESGGVTPGKPDPVVPPDRGGDVDRRDCMGCGEL
jgi:hypothetical protein